MCVCSVCMCVYVRLFDGYVLIYLCVCTVCMYVRM